MKDEIKIQYKKFKERSLYNVTILYKKYSVNTKEIKKKLQNYIKTNKGIETVLGKLTFTNSDGLGEGGNGLVYLSEINKKNSN